ncbi:MAG: hypothetical protein WD023_09055 [Ilumatobacteraceae bacterium]
MRSGLAVRGGGVLGGALSEGQATTRVLLAAGGLVVLGIVMAALTVWWWRGSRREPTALASLEVMSDRKFLASTEADRERLLSEHQARSHRGTVETQPTVSPADATTVGGLPLPATGD